MKHTTYINYEGSMDELVNEISNLRYDALAEFLQKLSEKIDKDSLADKGRDRIKLSEELSNAANSIRNAWIICKPFMRD